MGPSTGKNEIRNARREIVEALLAKVANFSGTAGWVVGGLFALAFVAVFFYVHRTGVVGKRRGASSRSGRESPAARLAAVPGLPRDIGQWNCNYGRALDRPWPHARVSSHLAGTGLRHSHSSAIGAGSCAANVADLELRVGDAVSIRSARAESMRRANSQKTGAA
jgi:hypothetical protein